MLITLLKYKGPICAIILILLVSLYYDNNGYNRADAECKLAKTKAENTALKDEIDRRKRAEDLLIKEQEKYNDLDKAYAKAIKTDVKYKCVIPDSLVQYLNSI